MQALLGTSGYNYEAWRGTFYPEDLPKTKMLSFYASRLPAVEINYSFYRRPTPKILTSWASQTPPTFRFALKAWQRITHQLRLKDAGEAVASFCETALTLGPQLGPILFQLPPFLKKDTPRLREFLAQIPPTVRAAFEFRHASWFEDDVAEALKAAHATLCIADSEELSSPLWRTAPFGYFRLRRQDYDAAAVRTWAEKIRGAGFEEEVFIFFKHEDRARGAELAHDLGGLLAAP
jgi:uncharacterized protein YecE (DUF72 family)